MNTILVETEKYCLLVESLIDINELSRGVNKVPNTLEDIAPVHRKALFIHDEYSSGVLNSASFKDAAVLLRSSYSPDLALLSNALEDCQHGLDCEKNHIVNTLEYFENKYGRGSRDIDSHMFGVYSSGSPESQMRPGKRKLEEYCISSEISKRKAVDCVLKSKMNICIEYNNSYGYHLRVTNKYQNVILNYIKRGMEMENSFEIILISSQKSGILFTTKQVFFK